MVFEEQILDKSGQIRKERLEDLLVEISTGMHLFVSSIPPHDLMACRNPTEAEQGRARIIYVKAMHNAIRSGCRTRSEMEELAINTGQFDPKERLEKKNLEEMAERLIKARLQSGSAQQKLEFDAQMITIRDRLIEIELSEEEVFQHSAESRAEEVRTMYLVSCCTLHGDMLDEPVWNEFADLQESNAYELVRDSRRAYLRVSQGLPIKIIRAVARASEWRSRWKSVKDTGGSIFEGTSVSWDRNKLNLLYWSDFYDSVYAHPECPKQEIINNDDALQLWLNDQIAKRHKPASQPSGVNGGQGPTMNGKPMQKLGERKFAVNSSYKVRVKA